MEKFDKEKWINFAKETLELDGIPYQHLDLNEFGNAMENVYGLVGYIESVLWHTINPNGTEDKTWVRVWGFINNVKEYDAIMSYDCLDCRHAHRIYGQFMAIKMIKHGAL